METVLKNIEKALFDVRFWILILFLIRLENIQLPPLDEHDYRQCLTLGVARSFLEVDANIFAPRTILCDSRPGFEVMEFPVLNYAIFILWKIFGENDSSFRLLGILVASFGLWHFHQIVRRIVDDRSALAGTVLFGTSIAFIYARKAMPDVFSLSMVLIGINIGWNYLEQGKWWRIPLIIFFLAFGLLSKIPSASALAFLAVPFLDPKITLNRKINLGAGIAIALAAMSAWYFVWIPWAEKEYHHNWFFRLGLFKAWNEVAVEYRQSTLQRFYPIALQSRVAFFSFLAGLIWMFVQKQWRLVATWLVYSIVFLVFILQVGMVFSGHEYYVIPYTAIMGLVAGFGLASLVKQKWAFLALLIIMAGEAIYWQKHDFFIPWQKQKFTTLKKLADENIPKDAKILTSDASPLMMYFAHRRGWSDNKKERVLDKNWTDGEATVGMHSAIIERSKFKDSLQYPMVFENNEFRIFKIKKD